MAEPPPGINKAVRTPFHREVKVPIVLPPTATPGVTFYSPEFATTVTVPSAIDQLFKAPSPPPSGRCPMRYPGSDPESTDALIRSLNHNHVHWHIFFNYKGGFHSHVVHHLLAIWSMGASGKVIEAAYGTHCEYQRPAFESPGPITHDNIYKHLGDERYYNAYLKFFTHEALERGLTGCLEEYIFRYAANFTGEDEDQPEMLSRFFGSVIHALIHIGHGAEFGMAGAVVEGLAQAAVHPSDPGLILKSWFSNPPSKLDGRGGSCDALAILSLVACDSRFSDFSSTGLVQSPDRFAGAFERYGTAIHEYVKMWKFDVTSDSGIADAIEELSWMSTMIYGVSGHVSGKPFRTDFFLMHVLTSSLFLPSLIAVIPKFSSRRLLLLGYLITSLVWYVARGQPALDVQAFYEGTKHLLHKVPGPGASPAPGTLPQQTSDLAQTPNTWLSLIQTTLVHPNDHLSKVQRALAHYSTMYGMRRRNWIAGRNSQAQPEVGESVVAKVGLGELDGTLFLRVAVLTQNKLGWIREGEPMGDWDR